MDKILYDFGMFIQRIKVEASIGISVGKEAYLSEENKAKIVAEANRILELNKNSYGEKQLETALQNVISDNVK